MHKTKRNVFKWLWNHTIFYRTYDFISSTHYYLQDKNLISDTFYGDAFHAVIKQYLNIDLRKDWIGRLYGVINPNIDIDGKYNFNNVIIEIDGDNTNNNDYIKSWVFKQMKLIAYLFKIERLYDYISIDFEHVGPVNQDNYLVVFDITSRKAFTYSLKKFLLHLFLVGGILAGAWFLFAPMIFA